MTRLMSLTTLCLMMAVSQSANAGIITFQQGVAGYAGSQDTYTDGNSGGSNFDSSTLIVSNGNPSDALIRFNNIFGAGASQISLGATINSATLTLEIFDAGVSDVRRMMTDWDSTTITYSNAFLNGNTTQGIQADGLEASLTPTLDDFFAINTAVLDVTSDLQAWSSGSGNFGWAILNAGNDTRFRSSEFSTISNRPLLTVTFNESAAVPEPSTFTLVSLGVISLIMYRWRLQKRQITNRCTGDLGAV